MLFIYTLFIYTLFYCFRLFYRGKQDRGELLKRYIDRKKELEKEMLCQRKYETDLRDWRPNKLERFIFPFSTIAQSNTLAINALWHANTNTHYNNTARVCVQMGMGCGRGKTKIRKREVREREMADIWNEWKTGGKKKHNSTPKSKIFSCSP